MPSFTRRQLIQTAFAAGAGITVARFAKAVIERELKDGREVSPGSPIATFTRKRTSVTRGL